MTEADEPKDSNDAAAPQEPGTGPATEPDQAADPETDQAVDDIVRKEGDEVLKAQDEAAAGPSVVMKLGRTERFKNFLSDYWGDRRKKWSTIGAIIIIVAAAVAVPYTRYEMLGLFARSKVTVEAVDSRSGAPVSGAQVRIGGEEADTNAEGKAVLTVHTGSRQMQVSKKYYAGSTQSILVTLSPKSNAFKAKLVALGRQVKVKVVNKITGKAVEDAAITAGGASAKTGGSGLATVVLPSGSTTEQASVSLVGYNTTTVTIDASGSLVQNTLSVTPSGKLYFLSNLSGTIDVVKTNLDGTDRQTVLAGTGSEDPNNTSLLASRDWKYLALLSKRSGNFASLYLIDTTNGDKLTTINQGSAALTPIGWSGDRFIYEVDSSATISDWQPDQQSLKSFDPTSGQTLLLDQTQGSGSGSNEYLKQSFGQVYLMGDQVVYAKNWQGAGYEVGSDGNAVYNTVEPATEIVTIISGKEPELDSINGDGSNHQVLKSFASSDANESLSSQNFALDTTAYEPGGLYIYFPDASNGGQFYDYEDGKVTVDSSLTADGFYSTSYPTYLLSPSGNNTFWAQQRDGKNTLFTGDENGNNQTQIASLSDYTPYGWYTDDYLLVSQNSSELYVLPAGGGTPLNITDYYKPPINYNGYGGL